MMCWLAVRQRERAASVLATTQTTEEKVDIANGYSTRMAAVDAHHRHRQNEQYEAQRNKSG